MALSGDSATSVKHSAGHMMKLQQDFVFKVGYLCITAIFSASVSLTWARRPQGQAVLTTLIYLSAYLLLVVKGYQVYQSVNNFGSIDAEEEEEKVPTKNTSAHGQKDVSGNEEHQSSVDKSDLSEEVENSFITPADRKNDMSPRSIKAMGQLWFRDSIDLGGQLHERFAALQKGVLEIYRNERDFQKGKDPINELPSFQLKKYALELDTKKFKRGLTSGKKSFRRLVSGQGEISLPVFVASEFDLKTAVKKYQFIIYPKVLSEVNPLPVGEFMANDETSYKQWVEVLQTVMQSAEKLEKSKIVDRAMSANADIELVEHAVAKTNI
eukprot:CAMPEP_0114418670 /NCGR_PEP_ID=MMETSP0103-20121206/3621_1 /TAXON_ID=37642 ORGANISM="Paraphysomonas imperforata, Strain PA2" /NCGR_SAMPLE_ID=MMETSP0103 /ASSEMBLY_ACC=CAM_ASM_000201 /LENGTH=324 /DNA_ID=CAMNT_0001587045 /DNA_START=326 /DNA_END=1302 /DNA_ORIENTATION=+